MTRNISKVLSEKSGLEAFYAKADPWGYFSNPHDISRQRILANELSRFELTRVLDIGCGNGFITETIDAKEVIGIDISESAIREADDRSTNSRTKYLAGSLFDLPALDIGQFDAVLITGVLYSQYIGNSHPLVCMLVDRVLKPGGTLISVHIDEWYQFRFPYPIVRSMRYAYREYTHLMEIYRK